MAVVDALAHYSSVGTIFIEQKLQQWQQCSLDALTLTESWSNTILLIYHQHATIPETFETVLAYRPCSGQVLF